jgi:cyclic beta-1,2-glucan synthetase
LNPDSEPRLDEQAGIQPSDLEDLARRLAAATVLGREADRVNLVQRLGDLEALLLRAQRHYTGLADQKMEVPSGAEWLLDNYYLVQQVIRQVRQDMPEGFYRQLPVLAEPQFAGLPRIYVLASELISACEIHLDPDAVRRFVIAYQSLTPLTIGELWALPAVLRLAVLDRLRQAVSALLGPLRHAPQPPDGKARDLARTELPLIATCILDLRAIDIEDWKTVFEDVSRVEQILRQDPAQVYARMDFETRDRYRKVIEHLAWASGESEEVVAQQAIELAVSDSRRRAEGAQPTLPQRPRSHLRPTSWPLGSRRPSDRHGAHTGEAGSDAATLFAERTGHVGFYLLDRGLEALEARLGYAPPAGLRLRRWLEAHTLWGYLGSILSLTVVGLGVLAAVTAAWGGTSLQVDLVLLIGLVPAVTVAVGLIHSAVPRLVPPQLLLKMEFQDGIPRECTTLVAIPALLTSAEEIEALLRQLEQHYLSTLDHNLLFALLTDFTDAPHEHMPGDEALLAQASEGVRRLNVIHGEGRSTPFHLLHRKREWNPREGVWMGWERKRGKLVELNRWLSGEPSSSYVLTDPGVPMPPIRYVITLDADSLLTRGGARRLIATLAHPLNQAAFDPQTGALIAGYTVLQPRVRVKPASANRSILTRLFAGDRGLDLYTQAVSDVYQDLFQEGIYVGKGIMDVAAFRRSLEGRVPENALLSHDLFEGIVGRAGLVADVVVLENYPDHYLASTERQHRWMRGDWQLLPWLLPWVPAETGGAIPNDFSTLDRWKILDNLRRSLLAPSLLAFLFAGWLWLPGPALFWTAVAVLTPGTSILAGIVLGLRVRWPAMPSFERLRPLWMDLARWALALAFLPFEALLALDAIGVTLARLILTRRRLLEWTPAANISRALGKRAVLGLTWRRMASAPIMALAAIFLTAVLRPSSLAYAGPLLLAWLISPQVAQWISRPIRRLQPRLTPEQRQRLGVIARRTWLFYERFVGPEDHWLPPDHFQESPRGQVAHHTSPTNIGFLLLSGLAASDLGYVGLLGLALRLNSTLDTLDGLERHRGHFLNWYDTRTLAPLPPRYVSTVDSGNLAGCLIALSQGCLGMPDVRTFRRERWHGLLDTLALLGEGLQAAEDNAKPSPLHTALAEIRRQVLAVEDEPQRWTKALDQLWLQAVPEIDRLLMEVIEVRPHALSPEALDGLRLCSERVRHHVMSMRREVELLVPWAVLVDHPPALFAEAEAGSRRLEAWRQLVEALPATPRLGEISDVSRTAEARLESLQGLLAERPSPAPPGPEADRQLEQARAWCAQLAEALQSARLAAGSLLVGYRRISQRCEALVQAMDFSFLFDRRRQVFHIGFNLDAGKLDDNHYDLLASEARLASLVAIAKRDVPLSHWLHLGRPLTRVNGSLALLSWSGTMFEYLMPLLLTRSYSGTLLDQSCRTAVMRQMEYAGSRDAPWGISESGYYAFDAGLNYQYRAFGVPGLGLKRGLADDLVVAPYASLLALPLAAEDVLDNYLRFQALGMVGLYGLYEALDLTPSHAPVGQSQARVRSYMAHHHGMSMVALANVLHDEIMVRRFHADPRLQTVELLLQEQLPSGAPLAELPPATIVSERFLRTQVSLTPWREPVQAAAPRAHILSNGRYGVVITSAGGGYSLWHDMALTRGRADTTLEDGGTWLYVQDLDRESLTSPSFQPTASPSGEPQAFFYPYKAEFHRQDDHLALKLEVAVAAEDDVEIRQLVLTNHDDHTRRLRLTSYAEVVLAPAEADQRHPAFNKLFIESEFVPELNALLFHRRPRASGEEPVFLVHMLVTNLTTRSALVYETDRERFLGRGGTPRAPRSLGETGPRPAGATGATLDPILSLGLDLKLAPGSTGRIDFLTLVGRERADVLATAGRYQSLPVIDRAFGQARGLIERELREQELTTQDLESLDGLLSALLYPSAGLRASAETLASNRKGQHGLWGFGISGDYPILLVKLKSEEETSLVRDVLRAHAYWRRRGIKIDVVIRVDKETGYGQELQGELYRLMVRMDSDLYLNQRGGIYLLSSDQMAAEDRVLLETAARAILDGSRGTLAAQLGGPAAEPVRLPAFVPTLSLPEDVEPTPELPRLTRLEHDNGQGGFGPDGREYEIYLMPGGRTPRPWINVIANPRLGFTVSEVGAGSTWAENSSENRLTPWSNDPVSDPPGEALYLRDEETALIWSPTPEPAPAAAPYLVRHGAGYSIFEHHSHGLRQQLRLFAAAGSPVKVIALRLENVWQRSRRLTATYYAPWVLGTSREATAPYVISEYEPEVRALLAHNPYSPEFAGRYAFLAASQPPHGVTADRTEFIGRMGDPRRPAALSRVGLEGTVRAGLDPCAAIQLHVELEPGQAKEIFFLLGQGADRDEALSLARAFGDSVKMEAAWQDVRAAWDERLGVVTVSTPDPAMDVMLNRWLLYQVLACRVWGRSALYQSSGAFGFRDQLQDSMALVHAAPSVAREHILLAARHQFEEGDVLHWWHPPAGRGVRTRVSDDLLWLPFVAAHYVEATGDASLLSERVPFLTGSVLRPEEDERYGLFAETAETHTLYEHCRRALERGSTVGAHGLPLIGSGDWNDGMNRVGAGGQGESVWLGWFLHATLSRFASLSERLGRPGDPEAYRQRAEGLRQALESAGWDGGWYRRAYFDDGQPLGAAQNDEWRIDSVAQSWAVLSGAGDVRRAEQAMRAVQEQLVRPADGLVLLATPPFDQTARDPGYIKGYPPGVRENGGAYQHAAMWVAWACADLGWGDDAHALFCILNPVLRSDTPEKMARYQVEPYVVAADIHSHASHAGQGGWTWYTGSAAWMYRLGIERILGLRRTGAALQIDPCIPSRWPGYRVEYRYGRSVYRIEVNNPNSVSRGVREVHFDGASLPDGRIPLIDDGATHSVQVRLG